MRPSVATLSFLSLALNCGNAKASYAPFNVSCPTTLIREASNISSQEQAYLTGRTPLVQQALEQFLTRTNISGLDVTRLFSNTTTIPRAAFAVSGGGLRAMIFGGAIYNALDSRVTNDELGGILQGCQYMAGLSGGSWLITGAAINNFATVPQLVTNHWDVDDVFSAPQGGIINTVEYYTDLVNSVQDKNDAGFYTTITDYWGRAISYHLLNASTGIPNVQFSDIQNQTSFMNYSMPFPIIVADGRAPGTIVATANATVYEFNPYEFGSWDEQVNAFTPTQYLGSNVMDGRPVVEDTCITGFDNVGFSMGTSSSLFNGALTMINGSSSSILTAVLTRVLTRLDQTNNDIAFYPNPWRGLPNVAQNISNSGNLTLTDGGMDNQNIPLWPLIQPEREVDVIFAVDSSADTTYSWPNGSSLVQTYQRVTGAGGIERSTKNLSFPYVPDVNTFVNLGLNLKPTFFGCNGSNGTLAGTPPPLIIYIPNAPYSYYSNFSTFDGQYSHADVENTLNNGFNILTGGNSSTLTTCIACAMVQRALERGGITQPAACQQCFTDMCWNGTIDATQPSEARLGGTGLKATQILAGVGAASTESGTISRNETSTSSSTTSNAGIAHLAIGTLTISLAAAVAVLV